MSQVNVEPIRRMYECWLRDDARLFDVLEVVDQLHARRDVAAPAQRR
jgi:hypothetical protein